MDSVDAILRDLLAIRARIASAGRRAPWGKVVALASALSNVRAAIAHIKDIA